MWVSLSTNHYHARTLFRVSPADNLSYKISHLFYRTMQGLLDGSFSSRFHISCPWFKDIVLNRTHDHSCLRIRVLVMTVRKVREVKWKYYSILETKCMFLLFSFHYFPFHMQRIMTLASDFCSWKQLPEVKITLGHWFWNLNRHQNRGIVKTDCCAPSPGFRDQ